MKNEPKPALVLTAIIIKDKDTENYTGILREIEGVIAQGSSIEDVMRKLPIVLNDMLEVNKDSMPLPQVSMELITERELVYA